MIVAFVADILFVALTILSFVAQVVYPRYNSLDLAYTAAGGALMMALIASIAHVVVFILGTDSSVGVFLILDFIKIVCTAITIKFVAMQITQSR